MVHPLPATDLDELARYLSSDRSPDGCLGLGDLDGFLTGIVVGPEHIPPAEWLRVVWGGEEPRFESNAEAREVISLIMRRHGEIAACFQADRDDFQPMTRQGPDGSVNVAVWAAGFLTAVKMRRKAWEPLLNHTRAKLLLEPLLILGDDGEFGHSSDSGDRRKEFYSMRPTVIPTCVIGIHNFWMDQRERGGPKPRRHRRPRR